MTTHHAGERSEHLLRRTLRANAAFSAAGGTALVGLAAPLSRRVGVPVWLLAGTGLALLPFAYGVRTVASSLPLDRRAAWAWSAPMRSGWRGPSR